jgi:NCAIR mutase (PurE)-related protein
MDPAKLRELLGLVQGGATSVDDAVEQLKSLPFVDLGYAKVDHHRALRQGVPEVVFAQGKSASDVIGIANELARTGQNVLITRLDAEKAARVVPHVEGLVYNELGRVATVEKSAIPPLGDGTVVVVGAGTADIPVAEECAETLRMLGAKIERVNDVGIAGIHRLLDKRETFERAAVVIVIAGMEGALPSAVGGLVSVPVIAVPTSVGYGAALGGLTAMFAMLTSCSSGITVCNVDNGFGAAFAAGRILRARAKG